SKQLANMKAWMMISMLVDQSDFLGEQNRQAASAFKNVASGLTQIESKEKMLTPN
ncbi:peptidase M13, partial [Streptococcus agalactiae]|nr:peptidase M13 [Streptococcus agalactiae]MCC9833508.1 peptidase M13 [Streptococcus agalactiae]MCC9855810.1 peptidase M13 [Streptococcus agalactiae]MCC9882115.1 peptidase M13 [Streptococcus agalactiae]MCK6330097.1 peptidase M13 [Streptococcus agalactiae]